jgi:hypothetical protein
MRCDGQPCPDDDHPGVNVPSDPLAWPRCTDCNYRLPVAQLEAYGFTAHAGPNGVLWNLDTMDRAR